MSETLTTQTEFDDSLPVRVRVDLGGGARLFGEGQTPWCAVVDALYPHYFAGQAIGINWDEDAHDWDKWTALEGEVTTFKAHEGLKGRKVVGTWQRVANYR